MEKRKPNIQDIKKYSNTLPIWGNDKSMNLNHLILANIQGSHYFKINLLEKKTFFEVVDEIYYHVSHLEPWEKGSRKTAGQTGMCGGVRGVGAGGVVSSCFCILFKLFTLRITRRQLITLLNHKDSPYIRGIGFMYIRFCQPPTDLWDWYESYFNDPEEIDVKAGGGCLMTIGEMLHSFLTKLEWFATLFPRIPVPVQQQLMERIKETTFNFAASKNRHPEAPPNNGPACFIQDGREMGTPGSEGDGGRRDVSRDRRRHSRSLERRSSRERRRSSRHHSRDRQHRGGGREGRSRSRSDPAKRRSSGRHGSRSRDNRPRSRSRDHRRRDERGRRSADKDGTRKPARRDGTDAKTQVKQPQQPKHPESSRLKSDRPSPHQERETMSPLSALKFLLASKEKLQTANSYTPNGANLVAVLDSNVPKKDFEKTLKSTTMPVKEAKKGGGEMKKNKKEKVEKKKEKGKKSKKDKKKEKKKKDKSSHTSKSRPPAVPSVIRDLIDSLLSMLEN